MSPFTYHCNTILYYRHFSKLKKTLFYDWRGAVFSNFSSLGLDLDTFSTVFPNF